MNEREIEPSGDTKVIIMDRYLMAWVVLGYLFTCGCGSGDPQPVPVSGTVQYQGKPLTQGDVVFVPVSPGSGHGARGNIGAVCHDILYFSVRVLAIIGLRRPRQQYPRAENATLAWWSCFSPPSDHTFYSAAQGSTANRPRASSIPTHWRRFSC